jgi:Mor family transcriptional regulator
MQSELFQDADEMDDLLEHMDDIDHKHRWPKQLADMIDVLADHFQRRRNMEDEDAAAEATQVITVIAHYFGGRLTYIPRDEKLRLALRDNLIWLQFNGRNILELANRHQLTEVQVYNIIREQRSLHVARVQQDMFQN